MCYAAGYARYREYNKINPLKLIELGKRTCEDN